VLQIVADDTELIRGVALDYIEGWYAGDAARMSRALHPALVKRIVLSADGGNMIEEMSAAQLVEQTTQGGGRNTPAARRRTDVRVLDVFEDSASVRVDAGEWIDYMHLARWNGEWRIVNVLWALR
jgi:hypothetical protein